MECAISVHGVHKKFPLLQKRSDFLRLVFGKSVNTFTALQDINFTLEPGESLGLVGHNGAGKSTLLKVLSGIMQPSSGSVCVNGRFSSILELATGFMPFRSGRKNIFDRLRLLGFSTSQIKKIEEEIIDFAELDEVIDDPIISYSTGMQARLAFAVATSGLHEILFIDELLAVGDELFQGKCLNRIQKLCREGRTAVIATHSIHHMEKLCSKALLLEHGCMKIISDVPDIVREYFSGSCVDNYKREFAEIVCSEFTVSKGYLNIYYKVMRHKSTPLLQLHIVVRDTKGIMVTLNISPHEKVSIPQGLGLVEVTARIPLPEGLHSGYVGTSLLRGANAFAGWQVEDGWGMNNQKPYFFTNDMFTSRVPYIQAELPWKRTA